MQIVIDIDEDIIECAKSSPNYYPTYHFEKIWRAIVNSTPLPKGHGELIDRDKIEYLKAIHDAKYGYITWGDASKLIKYSAPTIIEADKKGDIYAD